MQEERLGARIRVGDLIVLTNTTVGINPYFKGTSWRVTSINPYALEAIGASTIKKLSENHYLLYLHQNNRYDLIGYFLSHFFLNIPAELTCL
jgi:hypothetical protein